LRVSALTWCSTALRCL